MKLHKQLVINGDRVNLVCENIQLDLFNPGRANFTVNTANLDANSFVNGSVQFNLSYNPSSFNRFFSGFVESITQVDKGQHSLFCREYSAALFFSLPLALRSVTLKDVLDEVSKKTGLVFELPNTNHAYLTKRIPVFYNIGCGYNALDNLGKLFSIDKYFWRQQANGVIYVGSWNDHKLSNIPIDLNRKFETQVLISDGARIPAIPAIHPGVLYNDSIITQVEFEKIHMRLNWSNNPWKYR